MKILNIIVVSSLLVLAGCSTTANTSSKYSSYKGPRIQLPPPQAGRPRSGFNN